MPKELNIRQKVLDKILEQKELNKKLDEVLKTQKSLIEEKKK